MNIKKGSLRIYNSKKFFKKKKKKFYYDGFLCLYNINRYSLGIYTKISSKFKLSKVKCKYLNRLIKYIINIFFLKKKYTIKYNVLIILVDDFFFNLATKDRILKISSLLKKIFIKLNDN